MFIELLIAALAIAVAAGLWLVLRWYRANQELARAARRSRQAAATLECVAGAYLAWAADDTETASPTLVALLGREGASLAGLLKLFDDTTAARLAGLVAALHGRGEEFSETLQAAAGRAFRLDGRRARTARSTCCRSPT